jgi:hypothetical protein
MNDFYMPRAADGRDESPFFGHWKGWAMDFTVPAFVKVTLVCNEAGHCQLLTHQKTHKARLGPELKE